MPSVMLGTDPELFFLDGDGDVVPASTVIGDGETIVRKKKSGCSAGSDGAPFSTKVHADGLAAEITTGESTCRAYVCDYVWRGLEHLAQIAAQKDLTLSTQATVPTPEPVLLLAGEKAREWGCDPEYLAWEDGAPSETIPNEMHPERYAGGHIHLATNVANAAKAKRELEDYKGTKYEDAYRKVYEKALEREKGNDAFRRRTVRLIDYMAGLPSVLLEPDAKGSAQRRKVYGKAGAHRLTSYGIEYRTLSNFWLAHPWYFYWAFGSARKAVKLVDAGNAQPVFDAVPGEAVQEAINSCDRDLARELWPKVLNAYLEVTDDKYDIYHRSHRTVFEYVSRNPHILNEAGVAKSWNLFDPLATVFHGDQSLDMAKMLNKLRNTNNDFSSFSGTFTLP